MAAFNAALDEVDDAKLRTSLTLHDELGVLTQVSKAIEFIEGSADSVEEILFAALVAGAKGANKNLQKRELRAARGYSFSFDKTNPRATSWAKQHAGKLVKQVAQTTRERIRELVESAFESQFDVDDLAREIRGIIRDRDRALTIARTETMTAANQGQLQLWDQAKQKGLLTGKEGKEWITTPDDRLCPVCSPMNGEVVAMHKYFDVGGSKVDAPPAHPNCRCVVALGEPL